MPLRSLSTMTMIDMPWVFEHAASRPDGSRERAWINACDSKLQRRSSRVARRPQRGACPINRAMIWAQTLTHAHTSRQPPAESRERTDLRMLGSQRYVRSLTSTSTSTRGGPPLAVEAREKKKKRLRDRARWHGRGCLQGRSCFGSRVTLVYETSRRPPLSSRRWCSAGRECL
jgi:hypothetical protein